MQLSMANKYDVCQTQVKSEHVLWLNSVVEVILAHQGFFLHHHGKKIKEDIVTHSLNHLML